MSRLLKEKILQQGLVLLFLAIGSMQAVAVSPEREQELLGIWLEIRADAARLGDPDAQFDLAVAYLFGRGAGVDPVASYYWFRQASVQQHAAAHSYLGYLYGHGGHVPRDLERSRHHYEEAARLGDPEARLRVAEFYLGGLNGFPVDAAEAYFWFSVAGDAEGAERSARALDRRELRAATARVRVLRD